jgi:hypothetical protein
MIYKKGHDQSALFTRAVEQRNERPADTEAHTNGYIVGFNPNMSVKEYEDMGGGPVSASGMLQGKISKHSKDTNPGAWKK